MEKKLSASRKKTRTVVKKEEATFPIVAIGASAGGLDAVVKLIKTIPEDIGMAFFYIQHLSPDHLSNLAALLSKSTKLKVLEVKNGLRIKRNCLYVCIPNKEMAVAEGKIVLVQRNDKKLPYLLSMLFLILLPKITKRMLSGLFFRAMPLTAHRALRQ